MSWWNNKARVLGHCAVDVVGACIISFAARQITLPLVNEGPLIEKAKLKGQRQLDQYDSLEAEFFHFAEATDKHTCKHISSMLSQRLTRSDIEEFISNLLGDDFDGLIPPAEVLRASRPEHVHMREEYRIISDISIDRKSTTSKSVYLDILNLMAIRDGVISNGSKVFSRHKFNLMREIDATATSILSPNETSRNTLIHSAIQIGGFTVFCYAVDQFFSTGQKLKLSQPFPAPFSRPGRLKAAAIFLIVIVLHGQVTNMTKKVLDYINRESNVLTPGAEFDDIVCPPIIWPGGLREDPLTPDALEIGAQRAYIDEFFFRFMLLSRLTERSNPLLANAVVAIISVLNIDSLSTPTTACLSRSIDDCFTLNIVTALFMGSLYQLTGRIFYPMLFQSMMTAKCMYFDFFGREGILYEKTNMWSIYVAICSFLCQSNMLSSMVGTQAYQKNRAVFEALKGSEIEDTLDACFKAFKSNRRNMNETGSSTIPQEEKLTADEAYDFIIAFMHMARSTKEAEMVRTGALRVLSPFHQFLAELFVQRRPAALKRCIDFLLKEKNLSADDHVVSFTSTGYIETMEYMIISRYLIRRYRDGVTREQLREMLVYGSLMWSEVFQSDLDLPELQKSIWKWEEGHFSESELLDTVQRYYEDLVHTSTESALLFASTRGNQFIAGLAGRRPNPEEQAEFGDSYREWMSATSKRALLRAVHSLGLTTNRFDRVIRGRALATAEGKTLVDEWEKYVHGKYQTKLVKICGSPEHFNANPRRGSIDAWLASGR